MGIALFHLLPEANENFERYSLTPQGMNSVIAGLPMGYFIVFASYSLILFLEKVAFDSHALTEHTHQNDEYKPNEDDDILNDKTEPFLQDCDRFNANDKEILESNALKKSSTKKEKRDMADEYFISQNTSYPHKNEIFHDCFAVNQNKKIAYDKLKEPLTSEEIDSDQDENTIRHVVTGKGKFVSYLHARNLSKLLLL